jgi:DNA-binding NarL/FixJ family response regulator
MGIRVFLADDHAVVREGLRMVLEGAGTITVVGDAGDGRQAVRSVLRLCPDVVIMDIAMPELNGIEATRQIHQSCPATRVIILSMHASPDYIFRALQAGAYGYLLKESAGKEVVEAVQSVQSGHRYMSRKIAETVMDYYAQQGSVESGRDLLDRLSPREREILQLVVEGKSSSKIGEILCLSAKSVETYRSRLMQKLGIKDIPGLVKFAIQQGLISLES